MNDPMTLALTLAVGLIALGLVSGALQVRGLRRLAARKHVPSDEFAYLRSRYRRRLLTGTVLVTVGGLIAGSYLSGMERQADELKPEPPPAEAADAGPAPEKQEMTPEQKRFVRLWGVYWIVVVVLVFVLLVLAVADAWATRRYWLARLRQLREDHQTKLRRDLAVHRQQQEQARGGRLGNRLGGSEEAEG